MKSNRKATMYRQGHGWIVSEWDEAVQCQRLSEEMPWALAVVAVAQANCPHSQDGKCTVPSHQHKE